MARRRASSSILSMLNENLTPGTCFGGATDRFLTPYLESKGVLIEGDFETVKQAIIQNPDAVIGWFWDR